MATDAINPNLDVEAYARHVAGLPDGAQTLTGTFDISDVECIKHTVDDYGLLRRDDPEACARVDAWIAEHRLIGVREVWEYPQLDLVAVECVDQPPHLVEVDGTPFVTRYKTYKKDADGFIVRDADGEPVPEFPDPVVATTGIVITGSPLPWPKDET